LGIWQIHGMNKNRIVILLNNKSIF